MQIKIALLYIISNSFYFYWALKDRFIHHDSNFDDVSKIDYFRSQNKGILK